MALYPRQNSIFAFNAKLTFYPSFPQFHIIALQCDLDVSRCNTGVSQCDIQVSRCNILMLKAFAMRLLTCSLRARLFMVSKLCSFYVRLFILCVHVYFLRGSSFRANLFILCVVFFFQCRFLSRVKGRVGRVKTGDENVS